MYTYTYYVQSDILPLFKSMSQRQTSTSCPSAIAAPAKTPRPPRGLHKRHRGAKGCDLRDRGCTAQGPFRGDGFINLNL